MYATGRIGILAVLVLVLWMFGLDFFSGLPFGELLSMPLAYVLPRPSRERLAQALTCRQLAGGRPRKASEPDSTAPTTSSPRSGHG